VKIRKFVNKKEEKETKPKEILQPSDVKLDYASMEERLNKWIYFIKFQQTEITNFLRQAPHKTIGLFSGNQAGKTASVAFHYILRVLGIHLVPDKNILARKVRCMSSSLPENDSEEEQDNTQYLELKRFLPPEMIEKDITARSKNLVVRRPLGLSSPKTIFEFRSSKQELQDVGKIQLSSVWHDEETPKGHREECKMRLFAEGGDEVFSLTPINALSYCYDDVWTRASYIYRTKTIQDKFGLPEESWPNRGANIACIQMATDDNPILEQDTINRLFEDIVDPDELALRRYGVFKAISGKVHKTYDPVICYISMDRYFPNGVPYNWIHCRGIDYHESRTPWSIGWVSASPDDEWFLWQEFHPAIDGPHAYNTWDIANAIIRKSGDYIYTLNLIDPLAKKKQANTLFSTTDDLTRYFKTIHDDTGIGTAAFWEAWDTKDTKGRNEVAKRFKNAVRCGKPFNNLITEHGKVRHLPTLWIMHTCPKFHKSLMMWRYGEFVTSQTKAVNDPKGQPQQRFSHDNMVLECLAKDHRLLYASHFINNPARQAKRTNKSITGR